MFDQLAVLLHSNISFEWQVSFHLVQVLIQELTVPVFLLQQEHQDPMRIKQSTP